MIKYPLFIFPLNIPFRFSKWLSRLEFVIFPDNIHPFPFKQQDLNALLFFFSKPKKDKSKKYRVTEDKLTVKALPDLNRLLCQRQSSVHVPNRKAANHYLYSYRSFLLPFFKINHCLFGSQMVQMQHKIARLEKVIAYMVKTSF